VARTAATPHHHDSCNLDIPPRRHVRARAGCDNEYWPKSQVQPVLRHVAQSDRQFKALVWCVHERLSNVIAVKPLHAGASSSPRPCNLHGQIGQIPALEIVAGPSVMQATRTMVLAVVVCAAVVASATGTSCSVIPWPPSSNLAVCLHRLLCLGLVFCIVFKVCLLPNLLQSPAMHNVTACVYCAWRDGEGHVDVTRVDYHLVLHVRIGASERRARVVWRRWL
jgi:hypothetical protein